MELEKVIVLYGGKSTEHEISILSARNIVNAVDRSLHTPIPIAVAKDGSWYLKSEEELITEDIVLANNKKVALIPGSEISKLILIESSTYIKNIACVFPIIHGTGGEDGSLQGLLKSIGLPFVGPGVIGSALCIDKDIAKKILRDAGIKSSKFVTYNISQRDQIKYEVAQKELSTPMYIKPPNLGSSVGISKVTTKREFSEAIDLAFKFDKKVLIEESIDGREIECAVLGNSKVEASPVGEVITISANHSFYSYDAKYKDANGSVTKIPADLPEDLQHKIRTVAIKAYKALECEGMARVDVFVTENGEIIVNEINTLPGFTDISMYPKLWEATGKSYSQLISDLIQLAVERHLFEESITVDKINE